MKKECEYYTAHWPTAGFILVNKYFFFPRKQPEKRTKQEGIDDALAKKEEIRCANYEGYEH